jgi:hypothetical protein
MGSPAVADLQLTARVALPSQILTHVDNKLREPPFLPNSLNVIPLTKSLTLLLVWVHTTTRVCVLNAELAALAPTWQPSSALTVVSIKYLFTNLALLKF